VLCGEHGCTVEVENRFLHAIHLGPVTRFVAGASLSDGRVVDTTLFLIAMRGRPSGPIGAQTTLVVAYEPPTYFKETLMEPYVGYGPANNPPNVTCVTTPDLGATALGRAMHINVWCLARPGGCLRGKQQAPEVWALPETPMPGYEARPGTGMFWPKSSAISK
jgi:hypothetical protein